MALLCTVASGALLAQKSADPVSQPAKAESPGSVEPLPDVVALMHEVEAHQRRAEAVEKDYIYHSVATAEEMGSQGRVKKTTVAESDVFWITGVPVRRVVSKDGKPLTSEELAKEDKRIDKEVADAKERLRKAATQGKQVDPTGRDEITVSRWLSLGSFGNPRRVKLDGRDTIAVDFTGDPKAHTQNRIEAAVRDLRGTAWIDERDRALVRVEGEFVDSFKVGGGLLANVQKGTHFDMQQTRINDEVWLPEKISAQGEARMLLFFRFKGSIRVVDSNYRKFRTTSTVLPVTQADSEQLPGRDERQSSP